ncbi:MAG: hypothetical protein JWQ30_1167 [Sediminibacterium sp.]|nr:hypothetical protein [Sediminibacterium sp.]
MERVGTLINKLKEQFEQQAGADKLAVTAQLLLAELQKNHAQPSVARKISVVLPSVQRTRFTNDVESQPAPQPIKEQSAPQPAKEEPADGNWLFDIPAEIPTMAHQPSSPVVETKEYAKRVAVAEIFEFNTALANQVESLNEKLKEERVEVAAALQGSPIRDLKKAIGINDRFLFVNDLFRGDENMYERSIKTINGFTIYPEAEYWITRELKVKLSWPDHSETVKLFDQLIKRRFS